MNDLAQLPIGRRIAAIRKLRGLTQCGLAARLHRSESWVTKIERGERRVDSMSVLGELSRVLAVPVHLLTGQLDLYRCEDGRPEAPALTELRRALDRPASASRGRGAARPMADLQRDVGALQRLYDTARHNYSAVLPALPRLIGEAQSAALVASVPDRSSAQAALSALYRLAAAELRHSGDLPRAGVAIDRSMSAAEQSGDPLRVAAVGAMLTVQLLVQGDPADGVVTAVEIADLVAPDPRAKTEAGTAVLGALHAWGALAAARSGDETEARRLLKSAHGSAERLGRECETHGVFFGPANAASQEMLMLVDLGRPQEAARLGEGIPIEELGNVCRTGFYHVYLARAHSLCGNDDDALTVTATGLRRTPELVRHHPFASEVVQDMLQRRKHVGEHLRRVARELNLTA